MSTEPIPSIGEPCVYIVDDEPAVRDAIRSGELGRLVGVNVFWCMYKPSEYFVAGPWRAKKGGGPILINTIHEIDNLRYVCGEISRVFAEVSNATRGFEVEDTAVVAVRYRNGAVGSITAATSSTGAVVAQGSAC